MVSKGKTKSCSPSPHCKGGTAPQQMAEPLFLSDSGSWFSFPCNCQSTARTNQSKAQLALHALPGRVTALLHHSGKLLGCPRAVTVPEPLLTTETVGQS